MHFFWIIMLNRLRNQKLLRSVNVRPRILGALHRSRLRGHLLVSLQKRWWLLKTFMPPERRRQRSRTPTVKRKRPGPLREKSDVRLDSEDTGSDSQRFSRVVAASVSAESGEDESRISFAPGANLPRPTDPRLDTDDCSDGSVQPTPSQASLTMVKAARLPADGSPILAGGVQRPPGHPVRQSLKKRPKLPVSQQQKAPYLLVRYRTMSRFNLYKLARSRRRLLYCRHPHRVPIHRGRSRRGSVISRQSPPGTETAASLGAVNGWQWRNGKGPAGCSWPEEGLVQVSRVGPVGMSAGEASRFSSLGKGRRDRGDAPGLPGASRAGDGDTGMERCDKGAELMALSKGCARANETEGPEGDAHTGAEPPSCSGCCTNPLRDHRYCKSSGDVEPEMGNVGANDQLLSPQPGREEITELIHEFLESFYEKYGSFIPLSKSDVLQHLNKKLNADLTDKKPFIYSEVFRYQAGLAAAPMHFFKVAHNRHTLTLEDLSTLDNQNWVNDQVINMYGELIMEAVPHKVHFFNSFFHKQLITKGYEGVKRWTKKVDLFSKCLLLVPIHLEIHWSLIAVEVAEQNIRFYDSQGITFKHVIENILRYIMTEAREKQCTAFQRGWKTVVNKRIPQQKNDNDCGVFVLEYCKRLALERPLQFSQADMPRIRKRIYKELCECKLMD
ncbi:uncharacterized protein LOC125716825 [Brienomyrus brachyistius]|uniref:uncharacterized protein LOC125716825 n=1 Tax=Brienomyrus brachyistius TaxID=42636 RepID=UPI0020B3E424|nr:uncharacterized protein LOC125716825 [Brienomyrus brachyistius]